MFWWRYGLWGLFGHGLGWMLGGGLMMLLFWAGLIALFIVALRSRPASHARRDNSEALDILNARYARGEISKEEYDRIRHDIA